MSRRANLAGKRRWTKYGNARTEFDGITFDSKGEAGRWQELKLLERAGQITDLRRQVTYRLDVNGLHVCRYVADFAYTDAQAEPVTEDYKGVLTPACRIKLKLMRAIHGIEVRLVSKS